MLGLPRPHIIERVKGVVATALNTFDTFGGLTHEEQWQYVQGHRQALVGKLLIGVLSTGIYCLPICTARQPKIENIRFFRSESDAQAAGLRACRRCHPDYFYRDYDPDFEALLALVDAIQDSPAAFNGLDSMTAASGIGGTKLTALFRQHYHTTPAAFLSRVRIATACHLLAEADAARPIIDIAYESGYESLSAFYDNFRKATGLSPKDYQSLGKSNAFSVALPENYLTWVTRNQLGRDPESQAERVTDNRMVKALCLPSGPVRIHMEWCADSVAVRVDSAQSLDFAAMHTVHSAVIRMLGLATNPAPFERYVQADPRLARLIEGRQGLRIPLNADIFEGIAWAIIGQQVNLPFAYKLRRALIEICGQTAGDGMIAHPTAEAVAKLDYADLTSRQYSRRKAEYLIDTARLIADGKLNVDPFGAASQVEATLMDVRGLGKWSVNYIMMRALGFANCAPLGDTGLSTALQRFFNLDHRPGADETERWMEPFAPYRSLATLHLWLTLREVPE